MELLGMGIKFKDVESLLISNISAAVFAVIGLGLGTTAYLKFNTPAPEPMRAEIKDTRNPADVEREKKIAKANSLFEKGLYKNAEEILSELVVELPKNAHLLSLLSFSEKKIGRLQSAESHLKLAIELEPGQWALHNNLAILYFERGQPGEAMKSFDKALELSPKNHKVLLGQARVLEQIGKFTDARLSYGKAAEVADIDPQTKSVVKDRLKKLDVLAYIERGDK